MNQAKDHTKDTVEINAAGDAGAFFGVQAQREARWRTQSGHEPSKASIMRAIYTFENFTRSIHTVSSASSLLLSCPKNLHNIIQLIFYH